MDVSIHLPLLTKDEFYTLLNNGVFTQLDHIPNNSMIVIIE
jgi:hypothetical protein